jgi:kynurenine formamidase
LSTGVLIDISYKVQDNGSFVLEREDINEWESQHGILPNESIVLFRFGWSSRYYDNRTAYFGFENSNSSEMNFPGK